METQNIEKKKSKKLIIVVLILVSLTGGFVTYAYMTKQFFFASKVEKKADEYTYSLKEFVINLQSSNYSQYLKAEITVGYMDKKDGTALEFKTPQMRDIVIQILRSKTKDQVGSTKGMEALKKEIQDSANKLFDKDIITNVYVTNFLVQ